MRISSDLIPHSQFHQGSWLIPVNKPSWYYFVKQENPNNISNESFIQSVDPALRELVAYLHDQGIKTTPSCSGHFRKLKDYKNVYHALESDLKHIRNGGLTLRDIETGKVILYSDHSYKLPWNQQEFLHEVMDYQHHGVIGIKVLNKSLQKKLLGLKVEHFLVRKEDDDIILFEINVDNEKANLKAWKELTTAIINAIEKN
jgi:hypothetical protein